MDELDSLWQDTPPTSVRIVTAIARIAAVMRAGTWQFANAVGLNPTQVEILQLLGARAEGMRLSWVAAQLSVSAASASDSIAALVAKDLVEKTRAAEDGRALALRLSPAGRALLARAGQATEFAADAVERLPADTQQALYAGLLRTIAELQRSAHFPALRACVSCAYLQMDRHPDGPDRHHCALVDAPLPLRLFRLDCPEHQPAEAPQVARNWARLA